MPSPSPWAHGIVGCACHVGAARACVGSAVAVRAYVVVVRMYGGAVRTWGVAVVGFVGGAVRVTGFADGAVRACESGAVAVAISVRARGVVG